MEIIVPNKKEVFEAMKESGCTWCGGCECACKMRINMRDCFESTKKRLTKRVYTEEEIEEMKRIAESKLSEVEIAFEELLKYFNEEKSIFN